MSIALLHPLAALLPGEYIGWLLAALILVVGAAVGFRDAIRFSGTRIWAISGVCFDESIRRRILWITPLAILGIIVVSQLQRPLDEQDAIRQTIKICLFTTGLVVAISTIILACTNLPREIENRVIYTVVTKPTTRLEIVLGKVVGFARVSLAILLIMGVFTLGYLQLRAWSMQRYIADRIQSPGLSDSMRQTLQHYQEAGLLSARTLQQPLDLQVYARLPEPNASRWWLSGGEGSFLVPFRLSKEDLVPPGVPGAPPGANGAVVIARIGYKSLKQTPVKPPTTAPASTQPTTAPYWGPFIISPEERQAMMANLRPQPNATVSIEVLDRNLNLLGNATDPITNKPLELLAAEGQLAQVQAYVPPNVAGSIAGQDVFVRVSGVNKDYEFFAEHDPVVLLVPGKNPGEYTKLEALNKTPIFNARSGSFGQQLKGSADGRGPVAVYRYPIANVGGSADQVTFEGRFGIERSGAELSEGETDETTQVAVRIVNRQTGQVSQPVTLRPESNRPAFFTVPADLIGGSDFDVTMQCLTNGHYVGLQNNSLAMISGREPFFWNLCKSLLILWLMAILVTAVAIFTSIRLSWPIAVVTTLLILLLHWGVAELGDATAPGIGNQIVNDLGLTGSARAKAVSASVEKLSWLLNSISSISPDISRFAAVEDIERGVSISGERLWDAAAVALGFGIPLTVLAYVLLKSKEVAP